MVGHLPAGTLGVGFQLDEARVFGIDAFAGVVERRAVVGHVVGRDILGSDGGVEIEREHAKGTGPGIAVGTKAGAHTVAAAGAEVDGVAGDMIEVIVKHQFVSRFDGIDIGNGAVAIVLHTAGRE